MNNEQELMETVKGFIEEKGRKAVDMAKLEILNSKYDGGAVSSALEYFAKSILQGGMPVFPALLSLCCEAVGGKNNKVTDIGAALIIIAAAADIHDDVIDQSKTKYSRKTVFGKFGAEVAVLAGDALLIQGITLLNKECEVLTLKQRAIIQNLLVEAFFDVSKAEAIEIKLKKRADVIPQEYFEVIKLKAAVPELHCKIGAVLGNAKDDEVKSLGFYGKSFGSVSIVRDEFIDLMEYPELLNRIRNECLPLPVLYALQNPELRKQIGIIIDGSALKGKDTRKMARLVLSSNQVEDLRNDLNSMVQEGLDAIRFIKSTITLKELRLLLIATGSGF